MPFKTSRYLVAPNEFLGEDRPRPKAVKLGAIMMPEHDLETIKACFGDLWP